MKKQIKYFIVAFLTMFIATIGVSAGTFAGCLSGGEATCELTSDTEDMGGEYIQVNRALTIDLKGHTLKMNHTLQINAGGKVTITSTEGQGVLDAETGNIDNANVLIVAAGGELTLDNVLVKGRTTASTDGKNYQVVFASSNGTTKITVNESAKITGYNSGIGVGDNGNGKLTIDVYGTITTNNDAISVNGKIKTSAENIQINIKEGANLTSTDSSGIYAAGTSTVTVEGGKVTGKIGIVSRQGQVNVKGGTVKGNYSGEDKIKVGDSNTELVGGYAILVDNESSDYGNSAKTTISGGKLEASVEGAIKSQGDAQSDYNITGGEFDKKVDKKLLPETALEVKSGNSYYVGASAEKVVEDATSGTTIDVLQGTLTAEDVKEGVTVKNSGNGKVTVNGTELQNNQEITIPTSSSSSSSGSSSSKKDYTIVENVVYADNGENIEIEGKILKDADETYKAMIKMAEDKGYKTLYNMYDFWVKDNKSLNKPVTITFNLGESYNGKMAYIIHKLHDETYQELEAEVVDGKVSITVKELSPFTLSLKDNAVVDNPQTSSMNIIASGILTTMSLVGIIVLVKKRNA